MTVFSADEVYAAALHAHQSGDWYAPAEVTAADKAIGDLFARTDPMRKLSRDDQRLLSRYQRIVDAHTEAQVARYRGHQAAAAARLPEAARRVRAVLESLNGADQ